MIIQVGPYEWWSIRRRSARPLWCFALALLVGLILAMLTI